MTEDELRNWMAITQGSENRWTEDEIYRLNGHGSLYYTGGAQGIYLKAEQSGLLTVGRYEDAIPHIGDAMFTEYGSLQFPDYNAAFARMIEIGGIGFLTDMIIGDDIFAGVLATRPEMNEGREKILGEDESPRPDLPFQVYIENACDKNMGGFTIKPDGEHRSFGYPARIQRG
jgi:hypothetical protein